MHIVIPTLWKPRFFVDVLGDYLRLSFVEKVLLIDNAPVDRPAEVESLAEDPRLILLPQYNNLYVNHSWNLALSQIFDPTICVAILNDDVHLSMDALSAMETRQWCIGEIVGLLPDPELSGLLCNSESSIRLVPIQYDLNRSIGQQFPGFGSALFLLRGSYRAIPQCLRIWYGDDWLLRSSTVAFGIQDPGLKRDHHVTIRELRKSSSFRSIIRDDKRYASQLFGLRE